MELVAIITVLALMQFVYFGIRVGQMRGKHGVKAPDMTGDPEFMRMFRIHQNTMEQLVVFIPALWIFAHYWEPKWGAAIGLIYIASRFVYYLGYLKDPKDRGRGFGIGFVTIAVLMVGGIAGAVMKMM
jgi:glutathione S-transferase